MEFDSGSLNTQTPKRPSGRRRAAVAFSILALIGAAVAAWLRTDSGAANAPSWLAWATTRGAGAPATAARLVPEGTRIKVEVLNATDTRGLARIATFVLRDAGFDVVFFGNTSERADTTVVRDRSGHPEWAQLAAQAIQPSRTEVRADSGRLVDLTVVVGRSWRPPAQPLRP